MTWKDTIRKIKDSSLTPENIFYAEMPLSARTVKKIKAGEYKTWDIPKEQYEDHARGYIIDGVKVIVYLNEEDPSGYDGFSTFTIPDEREKIIEVSEKIYGETEKDRDYTKNPNKKGE
jgi:hypothetical protein